MKTLTSPPPRRIHGPEGGFSLMEMIVVMAVSTIILLVVLNMIDEASTISFFNESHNDLSVYSQRPMNAIQTELLQAKTVFTNTTDGNAYLTEFTGNLPSSATPAPNLTLPSTNAAGPIQPDTGGTTFTGNCLLIAKQLRPMSVSLAADGTDPTDFPAGTYSVDRYQFEIFYPLRTTTRDFAFTGRSDDLYRARSIVFADYFQLSNDITTLSASQRTALSTAIRKCPEKIPPKDEAGNAVTTAQAAGCIATAWNPGQPLASAFYTIDNNLAFPVASGPLTAANVQITVGSNQAGNTLLGSMIPELFRGRISGRMNYTVAFRKGSSKPGTAIVGPTGRNPVPRYFDATANTTPTDCGFEVQVVGSAGYRQVLTRLVLYSNYQARRYDSQQGFVITEFGGLVL
jgi:prepilin-type N-terminal cleavage/methylation domain-containing protein